MNAIEIRHLTKQFRTIVAVNDLTLEVPEGSIYGFIGPDGSGKTTTIRMIMNIILPDAGEIAVLSHPKAAFARDEIGYLPEERGLYKKMRVRRLLRYYERLNASSRSTPLSPDGWNGSKRIDQRRQGTTIFMIFKGHKVLDGTLDDIQARYGHDTIRLRLGCNTSALAGLPEIESVDDHGNYQDVRVSGDPQVFLRKRVQRTEVHHFEIAKPSQIVHEKRMSVRRVHRVRQVRRVRGT